LFFKLAFQTNLPALGVNLSMHTYSWLAQQRDVIISVTSLRHQHCVLSVTSPAATHAARALRL